jgi:isoquinoline 1-oxidoreductase beta subunit
LGLRSRAIRWPPSSPNAYLQVRPDNRVTVVCGSSEIRREVLTVIAMLLAGDLDAEWGKVASNRRR